MNCNCNNINNTDGLGLMAYISHVYGNVLRLAIPLTLRTVTMENGEMVATDTDFIPSSDYPVTVVFSKGGVKISLEATMQNGNIAYIEDLGTIPVGKYDIAVLCKDDNGNPYRFKQVTALHIVDATADANIPSDIEYEVTTWYLDAAIFLALKGEDGVGIYDIITESSGEIGGMNTVTIVLTNGETRTFTVMNGSGQVDSDFNINSPHPLSNSTITAKFNAIDNSIEGLFGGVEYDSQSKTIRFYNKNRSRLLATLDARPFIKDGMVNSVYISNNTLVITFNTDAGREAIGVSLSSIFNPNNYYTRTQVNNLLGNYYDKEAVNNFINNKADVLNDGRIPAIEAIPVVLDYIYAPPSGSPIIPINPQAGEVIYFANEHKIRRYYNKNSGQSGGIPAIVYVEETPSKNVVYYNKDDEKFYLYDVGLLSMVEIETGSGYEPPVGGIPKSDLSQSVQASLSKADTALQSQEQADWDESDSSDPAYIKNKPTIPDVSNLATKSELQSKADASNVYTKSEVDNALALKQGNITDLEQIRAGATLGASSYQKPHSGIPASDLADGVIPDVSGFVTSSDVADAVADLVNSAPDTLDTLNELAAALGDDPNFATTMATALGNKVDKVSGKGLSTEDYTTAEKTKLEGLSNYDDTALQAAVAGKVDKETGKSLMTDAERTKLQGIAAGAEVNVQPNWTQTNTSADDYIKNKPTLASVATSGSYADLSNKPTIPDVSNLATKAEVATKQDTLTFDNAPTANSNNPVKSGGVYTALAGKQATLVSGTNIKTVNNTSILGSGNISIPAGADGKSAYQSYLNTTSDSPVKTEAEWVASLLPTVVSNGDMAIVESEDYIDIFIYDAEIATTPTVIALDGEAEAHKSATLNVVGSHLKADIVVSVPTGFYVGSTGTSTSATLTATGGSVNTSVVIRHSGNNPNTDITGVVIMLTSGSLTKTVPLSYTRYAGPTILADSTLTIKAAAGQSNTGALQVTGLNLTAGITASVSGTGFTVSASESGTYGSQASLPSSGGTLYVKFSPTGSTGSTGTLTLASTGATSKTVDLTGAVATLTVSPSSLSFSTDQGVAVTDSFTIQGTNLTNGVSLSITGTNAGMFTLSKNSLTKDEAETGETITVTYTPTGSGDHSGNVEISWDGADKAVSLSGSAAAAAALDSNGRFQKGGIYYGAESDGNGGWTDNVKVYNSTYNTSAADTSASKYSGVLNIPSTVSALKNGVATTFTVIGIDGYAFRQNGSITSITLPDSLTGSFPTNAFYDLTGLTYINTGNGVTALGLGFLSKASGHSSSLVEIVFGDSLTNLDDAVCDGCSLVRTVTIGSSVEKIGKVFGDVQCREVTTIICRGTATIPVVNTDNTTAYKINRAKNITVYIPNNTRANYIAAQDNRSDVIYNYSLKTIWKYFDDNSRLIEGDPN